MKNANKQRLYTDLARYAKQIGILPNDYYYYYDDYYDDDNLNFRIIQNTTDIPDDTIRYIFQFVDPLYESKIYGIMKMPLKNLVVRILYESESDNEFKDDKYDGSYIPGIYWKNGDGLTIIEKPIISIILPDRNTSFPLYCNSDTKKGYLAILYLSIEEQLVHLIAHELRHHWQYFTGFSNRKTVKIKMMMSSSSSKDKAKEVELKEDKDADTYAIRQVRLWRKCYPQKDTYPDDNFWK
jgi:hypothetical protein